MTVAHAACGFTIVIEPPDTPANFKGFNATCDVLDSDFLMQPVNEADYDSETQACVDRQTGVTSFYDHYVTKRKKKKGLKGVGIECPAPKRGGPPPLAQPQQVSSEQPVTDHNLLAPPSRLAVPKGVLSNVAVRRIACGRMPPPQNEAALVMSGEGNVLHGALARSFADRGNVSRTTATESAEKIAALSITAPGAVPEAQPLNTEESKSISGDVPSASSQ